MNPIVFVRLGATDRYAHLRELFQGTETSICWDRRFADRRRPDPAIGPVERRAEERRRRPPETWTRLDYVVSAGR
jgi:hypothetical protein